MKEKYIIKNHTLEKCLDKNIKDLTIPKGINKILKDAFTDCTHLEKISFVNIDDKTFYIENSCFKNCPIKYVNLSGNIKFKENTFPSDSIESIHFSKNFNFNELTKFLSYFGENVSRITVEKNNIFGYESIDGVLYSTFMGEKKIFFYPPKKKDESFVIPKNIVGIDFLDDIKNDYIKYIEFPEEFSFYNLTLDCPNLTIIKVHGDKDVLKTSNFKEILPRKIICKNTENIKVIGAHIITIFEDDFQNCKTFKQINNLYKKKG